MADAPTALFTLALCATLVAVPAEAQDDAARQLLEQKIRLVGQLLGDSTATRRVSPASDAAAKSHYARAEELYALARTRLEEGQIADGIRAIDAAMGEIGRARSRAPHAGTRSAEQRARYEQRLSSVESLLGVLRAREAAAPAPEGARAIDAAAARIDGARGVAEQGRLDEATSQLDAAEATLARALDHYLVQRVVDYTVRPATPADAYRHELSRRQSLERLVPVALERLRPSADARAEVERHLARSAALRDVAETEAAGADHAAALRTLRESIGLLERALSTAGLVAPAQ